MAAYNYYSSPRLDTSPYVGEELISILIPARNEAHNLPGVLNSILAQRGVKYEVIILDDNSDDGTFEIATGFAERNKSIRVLRGLPLAHGWTGKNYACWQLAQAAQGDYLLFVDADVKLSPHLLSSALHRTKEKNLSLLSLFSNQQMLSFGECCTVPLMHYLLLTLLPIRLILDHSLPIFSAACGQFMFFPAQGYHRDQWHYQLRGTVAEDLSIMKAIKVSGLKGEGLMANGLVSCRMYTSFYEAVMGFSKNFIAPFNERLLLFIPFTLILLSGPIIIIFSGDLYQITLLALIIFLTRTYTSLLCGERWWLNAIMHPLHMISFSVISGFALQQHVFKSSIWKGRIV